MRPWGGGLRRGPRANSPHPPSLVNPDSNTIYLMIYNKKQISSNLYQGLSNVNVLLNFGSSSLERAPAIFLSHSDKLMDMYFLKIEKSYLETSKAYKSVEIFYESSISFL